MSSQTSSSTPAARRHLIALDLDGTLLDDAGHLSERNAASIRAAADAGHRVVLATGRPPHLVLELADQLGDSVSHVVGTNGTMIATFPDGELMQLLGFDIDEASDVVRSLRAHDARLGFAIATDAGFGFEAGFAERMPAAVPGDPIDDVLSVGGTQIFKLFSFHPDHTVDEMLDWLPALLPASLAVSHMGADAVDIGPTSIDKQAGLAWLCEQLGIDGADVIALGDEANDITMLRAAGRGIAMDNAPAHVKAAADEVAPSNNDHGVAHILEALISPG